jgi:hypothetical protein
VDFVDDRIFTEVTGLMKIAIVLTVVLGLCMAIPAFGDDQAAQTGSVTGITLTPSSVTLMPGEGKQFTATVAGTGEFAKALKWMVNDVVGGNSTLGKISETGLYITPFPAPASVTVKVVSLADASKFATAAITLVAQPLATGPALLVDAGVPVHAINPMIYGANSYDLDPVTLKSARLGSDRWGGNSTTRYNYKLNITNAGFDWFFENKANASHNHPEFGDFNDQFMLDKAAGAKTICTVPVIGWVASTRDNSCSFSVAKYGQQAKTDPRLPDCGNGLRPDKTKITNNDPNDSNMPITEAWVGDWVKFLVQKFGNAASGGVSVYALDNEPIWWDMNHRDVHPLPFTYDEVTNNGLKIARAIKDADPTAEVTGPVLDFWPSYFYSGKDIELGWATAPNNVFNGNATDRKAHGDVPFLEYYLRQFKAAQDADPQHRRLLDYLDLHTYFVANNAGFNPAGTTDSQRATIDSTRAFWDPTYTDPRLTDPEDTSKTPRLLAPQIIRRMKSWIAANYPGTKTAITEYNWGAQEHISGAVAQADILGIFGREGLDVGTVWGPPDSRTQVPGMMAFKIFRNYDNAGGEFGDMSLKATTDDQAKLSIYAAQRKDNVVTVMVINKSFGDLKSDVVLAHLTARKASVYQFSNADLSAIKMLPDVAIAAWADTSSIRNVIFPAMSITLFVVPKK